MAKVYLSIGSNIAREINIPSALKSLNDSFGELVQSSIYETSAVGFDGPPFFNAVVMFKSNLALEEITQTIRQIEIDHGRTKKSSKFSARSLDLDILLYGDSVVNDEKINIPRDDILKYAFVLEPLAEIAPDETHPISGKKFYRLWDEYDKSNLEQKKIAPPWDKSI